MKKMLYIAFRDIANNHFGIEKKILSQCLEFEKNGMKTDIIQRENSRVVLENTNGEKIILRNKKTISNNQKVKSVTDKITQTNTIIQYIESNNYDFCYIRYDLSDWLFLRLLKILKSKKIKVIVEIPTYPYKAEYTQSFMHKLKFNVDQFFAKEMKKYVDRIVTFYNSNDKIYGINTIYIPNGFDFSNINLIDNSFSHSADTVNIIGVSSMREWHGYERFILGMRNYYDNNFINRDIILHLVGNGSEIKKYKQLVEENNLSDYVHFYGVKSGQELDDIYNLCDLGIDSLARHRTGINVLSSLKSREYGSKGLPIINSCDIDIIKNDFNYLLKVPADESIIDMREVLKFYDKIYNTGKTRQVVRREIRSYIESKSNFTAVLKPVISYLNTASDFE
ncbi:glycosyltransferase [Jeotgalibaca caeni]|uniref:glycosyltransferase n=1 Tax=Jeotgalibaca caeni TaxID=3028623 RepID=UPI00237E8B14|nr:glycosyltransferase [Jeotgalibaca caeni]MDE1549882.1 glycosyltransferase [Jeotgalibaca caeni]